jgi:hypothetical protein
MDLPDGKTENAADEQLVRLRAAYETALRTYVEASAVISRQLADKALPSDAEFQREDEAAKVLETARRALWNALAISAAG